MPLEFANITFDLADQLGVDFDPRRTKVWITTNVPGDTVIDTSGKKIRLGSGNVVLNPDGTGTLSVWKTGQTGLNPLTWQTTIHVDYPDRNKPRGRDTRSFGPFTITASVDLTDLVQQQEIPPTYVSTVTAQLDAKVTDAGAKALEAKGYRDEAATTAAGVQSAVDAGLAEIDAKIVEDLGTTDAQTKALIESSTSQTKAALSATLGNGSNLGRFIKRCQAGRPVKVVAIGDSIFEGTTVTSGGGVLGTDDTLSLVATQIAARFGNTVTKANHALSGHTVARGPLSLKWSAAVAESADLYLIDYGTNDSAAQRYSTPVVGYQIDAFAAGLERLFRRLRADVPKADIAFLLAEPYNNPLADANNVALAAYQARARDVCAAYGVEVIDAWSAFLTAGAPTAALYADTIHPNKAGHALLASKIMEHLPAAWVGATRGPAAVPPKGLHSPENVATGAGQDTGADFLHVPTAVKWVETGTWSDSGSARTTTTPGDKISGTLTATEIYAMLDTSTAADLHATLKIDGATIYTNQAFDARPVGTDFVPLAVGLAPGVHTYELILVSGTLTVDRLGWLTASSGTYNENIVAVDVAADSTLTALTGTNLTPLPGGSIYVELPAGWGSMDVQFSAWVKFRITPSTTTVRRVRARLTYAGVDRRDVYSSYLATADAVWTPPVSLDCRILGVTARQLVSLQLVCDSTDKTNVYLESYRVEATLIRRS